MEWWWWQGGKEAIVVVPMLLCIGYTWAPAAPGTVVSARTSRQQQSLTMVMAARRDGPSTGSTIIFPSPPSTIYIYNDGGIRYVTLHNGNNSI